jgi:arsenate reductase
VPEFIFAQLAGAIAALAVARVLFTKSPDAMPASMDEPLPQFGRRNMENSLPIAVTIYHNPDCGTSRNTLALIRNADVEPTVIEYLKIPPDRATLKDLLRRMSLAPRALLREKGTPYTELGLGAAHWTDDELIEQMLANPILINRPIVVTPWGVKLCRPSEVVLTILPLPQHGLFAKEDGELVIDAQGNRVL